MLGLVTTKRGTLESKDALKRRIDEAAKFIPLEQLGLTTQCRVCFDARRQRADRIERGGREAAAHRRDGARNLGFDMIDASGPRRFRYTEATSGKGSWITHYFGVLGADENGEATPPVGELHPVAFLVEMDPERVLRPHFHLADQFQLFVTGSGTFGRKPLEPLSLHYADAYTPYGPIHSEAQGLGYFTLRNGWDAGISFMPESRDTLHAAKRTPRAATADIPASPQSGETVLIAPTVDGMQASRHVLSPGDVLTGPDPRSGRGQYWIELPAHRTPDVAWQPAVGCVFVAPHEGPRTIAAGAVGADVFVLQFPRARSPLCP